MEIISHRGYWKSQNEKNSALAMHRSFELNFGTETDIRDFNKELVISHDIPDSEAMSIEDFFTIYNKFNNNTTLALNIKSDGLQIKLKEVLNKFSIHNYFVFDMSIPDSIGYIKNQINFFARQSEYEREPAFYEHCSGIWLDSFINCWFDCNLIKNHLNNNKKVCIVSPELHKRNHLQEWEIYKSLTNEKNLILCTDHPEEAEKFFKINL